MPLPRELEIARPFALDPDHTRRYCQLRQLQLFRKEIRARLLLLEQGKTKHTATHKSQR